MAAGALALGLPLVPLACDDPIQGAGDPPTQESGQPPVEDPGAGHLGVGVERTGQEPEVIPLDLPADGAHMVTLTFTGDGFFQSSLVDGEGEFLDSLGTSSGDFVGTYLVDVGPFERDRDPSGINISSADRGSWSVLVQNIDQAPLWPDAVAGAGATVLRIDAATVAGGAAVIGSHDGGENFIVWSYGTDVSEHSQLFNEIGVVDGPANDEIKDGAFVIQVKADGNWSLVPS